MRLQTRLSLLGISTTLVLTVLMGCLEKEKGGKTAVSWAPPWDSAQNIPRALVNFHYEGPESLFTVFHKIEVADSLIMNFVDTLATEPPIDTLRIHHLFDTGFVFPAQPEASMPFAFDESYRDDTLFRKAFGNGLFEQEHPCVVTWVLSGEFLHPAKWLRAGMTEADIRTALGAPQIRHPNQLRYLWHSQPNPNALDGDSATRYESIRFYFESDSLYATLLQQSKPCF